ncbi:unnamed protein product [Staurois parvus]|uniref:Uncharacterized protein n=1 Tax=Staurois parvus TaxID=386267 RepID=A0ABN9E1Z9_9NEOB|nr:unnamed protein product [Staurois parvus]
MLFGHSRSPIHGKSRRCRLGHVISCVQSQLITWDMYTDDQCALMISVASSVPAVSAHLSCLSVSPINPKQCHLSMMPVNAHQCHLPVPPH